MTLRLGSKLSEFERRLRTSFGTDLSTPAGRRAAWWNFQLFDHAFLRVFWTNFDEVAPGVYRSNQPSPKRLEKMKAMGIREVLTLRGNGRASHYILEEEACARLGLGFKYAAIPARFAPRVEALTSLIETLRGMEKPFLLHCKSGADRAGMASALYLAIIEGRPIAEARKQLSIRYLHLSTTATGIIDHFFDHFEARLAQGEIGLEEWIRTEYDPQVLLASWKAKGGKTRQ